MRELVAVRLPGSQAAYEPWTPMRFSDVQALLGHLLPIRSTAFTDSGFLLITKLALSVSEDEAQVIGMQDTSSEGRAALSQAPAEERRHVENVIRLLDEWMADESGYDEETWPELKAALERDRLSSRNLFVD